jgi:hypothetical protein
VPRVVGAGGGQRKWRATGRDYNLDWKKLSIATYRRFADFDFAPSLRIDGEDFWPLANWLRGIGWHRLDRRDSLDR